MHGALGKCWSWRQDSCASIILNALISWTTSEKTIDVLKPKIGPMPDKPTLQVAFNVEM